MEFRSEYTYEYRSVTDERLAKQRSLAAQLTHCRQLLADLPVAKRNGETAMQEHSKSDEVDLNTLGAMYVEQQRIQQEIVDQTARLPLLEKELEEARQAPANQLHQFQTSITLPFGFSTIDGRTYALHTMSPSSAVGSPALTPVTITWTPGRRPSKHARD